ncbi:M1 family metallopeptidase [Herbiconiux sp. KACC 21604]|uniref:M1 family metallopeptidase n=1 Tax=unclassified Herbiconiux TaxID=2618217 RepID=UPI001C125FE9|nr:M1 family metallopeptidase [Herbiconiux sp. SALV-R1]WPO85772.1 M1 family metallopeptidase [Herbiconiux sp. KACC 21604]
MNSCELAATGSGPLPLVLLALAVAAVGGGAAWLLVSRRRRRGAITLAALPLLVLALVVGGGGLAPQPASAAAPCPPTTSPSPQPTPEPTPTPTPVPVDYVAGAAGIGDPYYPLDGNGGYDVQHYDLDLSYEPATGVLSGSATIEAVATENLSSFNLDFDTRAVDGSDALAIESVTVDGAAAEWSLASTQISIVTGQPQLPGSTDGDATPPRTELTVVPGTGIPTGSTITTTVVYSGVPITIDDAFGPAGVFRSTDGAVVVGQPRVAATWFPANDHPSDKATFTTTMSVPEGLTVVGNGRLADESSAGGRTSFTWEMEKPMATYLATATVGDYDITTSTVDGITYYDAIDPALYSVEADGGGTTVGDVAAAIFATEPEVIDFLEQSFGPYPFSEAGGIAIADLADGQPLPYALENQTRPIYPSWSFPADADASVVVHELAHQWYGDDVSMHRWSDIWLNEGFATYAEWLWAEHTGGPTPQQSFDDAYSSAPDAFWTTEIADPGAAGIFDAPVYVRGAMTLQALRTAVGDDDFFAILQGWAAGHAGGSGSTAEFVSYAESVSGDDLTALFDAWIYSGTKPAV